MSEEIDKILAELRFNLVTKHYDFHYDYCIEARNQILELYDSYYKAVPYNKEGK